MIDPTQLGPRTIGLLVIEAVAFFGLLGVIFFAFFVVFA